MDTGSNYSSVRRTGPLPSAPADVDEDGDDALDFFEDTDDFDLPIFYDEFWDWHTDPDCTHGFAYGEGCTECD